MNAASDKHESQAGALNQLQPPEWLELEPGEELLASYQGKQVAEVVVHAVVGLLGLLIVAMLASLLFGKSLSDLSSILTSVAGVASGLILTLVQLKKTQLHVTSKMLIFAQGKNYAGVPFGDVVAIKRGDGSRWTIGIYVRGDNKAIGKITVLNVEQTEAELKEYCRRGGARLVAEGAH